MDIYSYTDNAIIKQIGLKIKEARLAQNIPQSVLAKYCGLSQFTISQIENGNNTSLEGIISILRALNRLDVLNGIFAEQPLSPIVLSKLSMKSTPKKRAYTKKSGKEATVKKNDFNWDEQ